jgi:hypothetical protein
MFSLKDYVKKIEPYAHRYREFVSFMQEIDCKMVIIDLTESKSIVMTHSFLVRIVGNWSLDFLAKAKKEKMEVCFEMSFKDLENRLRDPEHKGHAISKYSYLRMTTTLEAYNNRFMELSGRVVQKDAMKEYQYRKGRSK